MATEKDNHIKPATESGAESPTTARPLEMDDDDVQETGVTGENTTVITDSVEPLVESTSQVNSTLPPTQAAESENAPSKPPRPLTEAQKNEVKLKNLKEAFPTVEQSVVKAVLTASRGDVEAAFHALLEMTDPEAVRNEPEDAAPAQPPRPQGRTAMSQLEADELYARQLAEHYDNVGAYEARTSSLNRDGRLRPHATGEDREHSFIDDDLPVITENLRKGFIDTQTKVNGWIANLRKKIEDNLDESEDTTQRQGQNYRRSGEASRRSGDYDRYDADPQVLSDDFAGMRFSGEGNPTGLHRPPPPSKSPRPSDGRRVGFKEGHEEINMYDSSPKVPPKDTAPATKAKTSKWQPLSSVDPEPITDNDPFSLGDSEDEKESKDKPKDVKLDEAERLKKAAAEAMADDLVESPTTGDSTVKKV